jgi:type VI secretion system protein ImpK
MYELCLLLGYRGRYGIGGQAELRSIIESVKEKMRRIRGASGDLSPHWAPPPGAAPVSRSDPWVKRLMFGAIGAAVLAVALFGVYTVSLGSGASDVTTVSAQSRG